MNIEIFNNFFIKKKKDKKKNKIKEKKNIKK